MWPVKHGLSRTRIYNIYRDMKYRCSNPNNCNYCRYGYKGIKVCNVWLNDFIEFYNWSMINGYKENLTIDRIDNDGNYCPENCRWTDMITQSNNKTDNHYLTIFGETKTLKQWSRNEKCLVGYGTFRTRIRDGMEPEKALTTPIIKIATKHFRELYGENKQLYEWAKDDRCKVSYGTLQQRLNRGWDFEKAITTPKEQRVKKEKEKQCK